MPAEQKSAIKQLKDSVTTPKYLFAGLMLIFAGVVALTLFDRQRESEEMAFLQSPKRGDVYKVYDPTEKTEYQYYLLKVSDISEDSIYFSPSSYSYNGLPDKLEPGDGFYNQSYGLHREEVMLMYDKGEIKRIVREYSADTGFSRVIELPVESTE